MTTQVTEYSRDNAEHRRLASEILDALKGIKYGSVEIVVHDHRVVQIDRRERFRFAAVKAAAFLGALMLGLAAPGLRAETTEELDQRLKVIERKLELQQEAADAAKKADATAAVGSGGFTLQSADKKYSLKLTGLLQADSRTAFEDQLVPRANDITLRRTRLGADSSLGSRLKLRIVAELAGAGASLVDGYADLKVHDWVSARVGRFKTPLSLENHRSDPARDFVEAGFSLGLTTVRDNGLWLELADPDQAFSLGGGVFNGGADGGTTVGASDGEDDKDGVIRLFVHPTRFFDAVFLRDLGIGVAGSVGHRAPATAIGSYRTTGQQSLGYRALTTNQDQKWRVAPQAYLFQGAFSFLGEYVRSVDQAANTTNVHADAVRFDWAGREAWQVSAGWVLTGEDASFNGLKWNKESTTGWGILQLVARYQEFAFDDANFSLQPPEGANLGAAAAGQRFLNPRSTPRKIQGWGAGLNWVPLPNAKLYLDWEENHFTDGASAGAGASARTVNRETEKTLFARAQFSY